MVDSPGVVLPVPAALMAGLLVEEAKVSETEREREREREVKGKVTL